MIFISSLPRAPAGSLAELQEFENSGLLKAEKEVGEASTEVD